MAFAFEYETDDLVPCEYCNELFPFLQIIEHTSGCEIDFILPENDDKEVFDEAQQDKHNSIPIKPKYDEGQSVQVRMKPDEVFKKADDGLKKTSDQDSESEDNDSDVDEENNEDPSKFTNKIPDKILTLEELDLEEPSLDLDDLDKGIKLLEYGRKAKLKSEEDKSCFTVPVFLLNNADQKEVEQQHSDISDDDYGESLEDFWKRAERKISQRLNRRIQL